MADALLELRGSRQNRRRGLVWGLVAGAILAVVLSLWYWGKGRNEAGDVAAAASRPADPRWRS